MSPLTVFDLHRIRYRHWKGIFVLEEHQGIAMVPPTVIPPVDIHKEVFYDAGSSLPSLDLLQLDDLFHETLEINCVETNLPPSTPPSHLGLNTALNGNINFLDCLNPSQLNRFPVIFDSGASVAITGNRNDFVGQLQSPLGDQCIGEMAQGAKVEGIGTVKWHFRTKTGALTLAVNCYYVPTCKVRLISPQRLLNSKLGITGYYKGTEDEFVLSINDLNPLTFEYDTSSHLPIGLGCNAVGKNYLSNPQANLAISDDANQNLTPAQNFS